MKVKKETRVPRQGELFILQEPLILKAVRRVCPETKRELIESINKRYYAKHEAKAKARARVWQAKNKQALKNYRKDVRVIKELEKC